MEISSTYIIYCCKLYGQCFKFWRYCKTFEAINEEELQKKVAETFEGFSSMFNLDSSGVNLDDFDLSGNKAFAEHVEKMTEGLSEEFKNMASNLGGQDTKNQILKI